MTTTDPLGFVHRCWLLLLYFTTLTWTITCSTVKRQKKRRVQRAFGLTMATIHPKINQVRPPSRPFPIQNRSCPDFHLLSFSHNLVSSVRLPNAFLSVCRHVYLPTSTRCMSAVFLSAHSSTCTEVLSSVGPLVPV